MNRSLVLSVALVAGCGSPDNNTTGTGASATSTVLSAGFMPVRSLETKAFLDGRSVRPVLPLLARRPEGIRVTVMFILATVPHRASTAEERARIQNQISPPELVAYLDPTTNRATFLDPATRAATDHQVSLLSADGARYFGISPPADGVIGRLDDPKWLPADRLEALRQRIYSALDILLPFFADPSRRWTEEANKAAQEARDFYPLAAEPGLWPYYTAEGKEFFAWLEKNAPPAKAKLPWGP